MPIKLRKKVVILGGGIHGTGLLHDLTSRNIQDVLLLEKGQLGEGTSSKSTKLIHGGLRYLERISQFHMVSESLRERQFLSKTLSDIVHPLELIIPIERGHLPRYWYSRAGLALYDFLSSGDGFPRHHPTSREQIRAKVPFLNTQKFGRYLSFFDGQTDDLALVNRCARNAVALGGEIKQQAEVLDVTPTNEGFRTRYRCQDEISEVHSSYVVNCLGPWANNLLRNSHLPIEYEGINNKGSHLLLKGPKLQCGMFLRSKDKKRIFFVLPWKELTLVGTTESRFNDDPDKVKIHESEITYLLDSLNHYSQQQFTTNDIAYTFSGLRWLAVEKGQNISATSRESILASLPHPKGGLLLTLYGGKLTSYRSHSEKIGNLLCQHMGVEASSRTLDLRCWQDSSTTAPEISERFSPYRP